METDTESPDGLTAEVGELTAQRREYAQALRACSPQERQLLRELPSHRYQLWKTARLLGYCKRSIQLMLRRPRFQRALATLKEIGITELGISNHLVLEEYVTLAKASLRDFYDENDRLLPPSKWPEEWAGAVQEYYFDKDGSPRIKLHEKRGSLDALAKYQRLAPERLEVTGKDGAPLIPRSVDDLTDEQLAAIAAGGRATSPEPAKG